MLTREQRWPYLLEADDLIGDLLRLLTERTSFTAKKR
jgi:hypothetical protein